MIIYPPPAIPGAGALLAANNLSDIASAAAARTSLAVESAAEALQRRAIRAARPWAYFDATTGARILTALGAPGDLSTSPLTMARWVYVDGISSSLARGLGMLTATSAAYGAGALTFYRDANALVCRLYGATINDWRAVFVNFFTVQPVGWHLVTLVWDRTGAPTILCDGVSLTLSAANNGTAPAWTDACASGYEHAGCLGNSEPWNTGLISLGVANGVLTVAEALLWAQTGQPPHWWQLSTGSVVAAYTFNGSSTDSWSNDTATLAAFDVNSTVAGKMFLTLGASGYTRASRPTTVILGRKYRCGGKIRLNSGSAATLAIGNPGGGTENYFTVTGINGTEATFSGEFVANSSTFRIGAISSNGSSYEIDDLALTQIGPVHKPGYQPGCSALTDSGENRIPSVASAGVTIMGDKPEIVAIPIPEMTADGFILADQALVPTGYEPFACSIERTAGASTGTITIRKTSSGGTTLFTGTLAATVALTPTLVPFAAADKLHLANSSWSSSTLRGRVLCRRALN